MNVDTRKQKCYDNNEVIIMAKSMTIRLDDKLYQELERIAKQEFRSVSVQALYMLVKAIEVYIEDEKGEQK